MVVCTNYTNKRWIEITLKTHTHLMNPNNVDILKKQKKNKLFYTKMKSKKLILIALNMTLYHRTSFNEWNLLITLYKKKL